MLCLLCSFSAVPIMAITARPKQGVRGPLMAKDNTQAFSFHNPISLSPRFAALKDRLVRGRENALALSWARLVDALRDEIGHISSLRSDIVPTINFDDITMPEHAEAFHTELRTRGVGIIRDVIPRVTAVEWEDEVGEYFNENPHIKASPPSDPQLYEVYWSPTQVKARAHPNVLKAQRFAMGAWHSKNLDCPISTNFPITYADRLRIRNQGGGHQSSAHIDGGSVERWEPDGYGTVYEAILRGDWEGYDPWESSGRTCVTSDLYRGAGSCSIFRGFQGLLALSDMPPAAGSVRVCPTLRLSTAYFLLRPFFSPPDVDAGADSWILDRPQNSILHGALPSYTQTINPTLHPHLELHSSLVDIPHLEPGDYVIWHPDLIHTVDAPQPESDCSTAMYLPACPLTQTNALYLCRQRKAFLLGQPGPDFAGGLGESNYAGRPGVQDISDAGGDDGLRAMGLLPFDADEASSEAERRMLSMANSILFPDLYNTVRLGVV